MVVTWNINAKDVEVKAQRQTAGQHVVSYFGLCLPESRLLCFLDDQDPPKLRALYGRANRGFYSPIHANEDLPPEWPEYVRKCIYPSDKYFGRTRKIDDLAYLYDSTCDDELGLTMTLAHELQHAVQHAKVRPWWAANSFVHSCIHRLDKAGLKLKAWADIPTEREARIVSKRVAECLFSEQLVRQYVDRKIAEPTTEDDVADWQFIRGLMASSSVDLAEGTRQLFKRLRNYRPVLEDAMREERENPHYADIDLDALFAPPHIP